MQKLRGINTSEFWAGLATAAKTVFLCVLGALVYHAAGLIGVGLTLIVCVGGKWAVKTVRARRARPIMLLAGLLLAGCGSSVHHVPTDEAGFYLPATDDGIRSACLNVELMREAGRAPADYNARLAEYGHEQGICD